MLTHYEYAPARPCSGRIWPQNWPSSEKHLPPEPNGGGREAYFTASMPMPRACMRPWRNQGLSGEGARVAVETLGHLLKSKTGAEAGSGK
jgi:hypothetical protein